MTSIIIKISLGSLIACNKDIVINLSEDNLNNTDEIKSAWLFGFMKDIIEQLEYNGKIRTAETYRCAMNSFSRFRGGSDILISEIGPDIVETYELYLKQQNLAFNTISFYMRILRAVYNRAVKRHLTADRQPFCDVYTSIGKTMKRAVTLEVMRKLKDMTLHSRMKEFARDMFLFSFYTHGMSFVDMAYLKQTDIINGVLIYKRKKTGRLLYVRWEKHMQQIVDKYARSGSTYLLPLISKDNGKERNQYRHKQTLINSALKAISEELHLDRKLSMYVARHSWASIARTLNVPVEVICRGMGHDSEKTTQIYLKTLDTEAIDHANRLILKALE